MTLTLLELPDGARIPVGSPAPWLAAAVAAGWRCECATPAKGTAKTRCGRSHWADEDQRCRSRAAGEVAVRLVLALDVDGTMRLMCEPCAKGHAARAAANLKAAKPADDHGQSGLFDLSA